MVEPHKWCWKLSKRLKLWLYGLVAASAFFFQQILLVFFLTKKSWANFWKVCFWKCNFFFNFKNYLEKNCQIFYITKLKKNNNIKVPCCTYKPVLGQVYGCITTPNTLLALPTTKARILCLDSLLGLVA
jgi:hypothetical protein